VLLTLAGAALAAPAVVPRTERVSVSSRGVQGQRASRTPALSGDGRFVVFTSSAENLVPGDTNRKSEVFVRDLKTGRTRRVSVTSNGAQANHSSGGASISSNGRYVVFASAASNLVPHDSNRREDVFLRDLTRHTTTRVSVSSTGKQRKGASSDGVISADGRSVAFVYSNGVPQAFVRHLDTHKTERVSVSRSGKSGNDGSFAITISGNGRLVAFESFASNLVSGDTNARGDVFVRDLKARTTRRISVSTGGAQGNLESISPSISADGRFVAFASHASNLVGGDTNGTFDTFLRDLENRTTERISVSSSGDQANGGSAPDALGNGAISQHGEFVVFTSLASNLVPDDTNDAGDVFLRDIAHRTTTRLSVSTAGSPGNALSSGGVVSADGRFVAFTSDATNLVGGDTNGRSDVFVRGPLGP
jgi:Tol biopolymer transport system component